MLNRRERLINSIEEILGSTDSELTETERRILTETCNNLKKNADVNRCVFDLKAKLSEMSVKGDISPKLLQYFTELSRHEPSTSVSSMWNFLIR